MPFTCDLLGDEVGCGAELSSKPVLREWPGRDRGGFSSCNPLSCFVSIYENSWLLGLGCGKGRGEGHPPCVLGLEKLSLPLSMDR